LLKALLFALIEPTEMLRELELNGDYSARLAWLEELKSYPFGAIWDQYCVTQNVPMGSSWLVESLSYEREVLALRT
jgi:L-rhamnose isomerase